MAQRPVRRPARLRNAAVQRPRTHRPVAIAETKVDAPPAIAEVKAEAPKAAAIAEKPKPDAPSREAKAPAVPRFASLPERIADTDGRLAMGLGIAICAWLLIAMFAFYTASG